ncbi:UMP kinase [Candidatus Woesearchaeota archaeon]|nr:UMP kinase [Candidatus Woesearchaeota archaeon]
MQTVILSLGGSVIAPSGVDVQFLKSLRAFILNNREFKFIIICGGGRVCRDYQKAASEVADVKKDDLDWIGVYSTRLNAQLVRSVLSDISFETIIERPKKVDFKKVLVVSGWKPGWSTDYIAVLMAKKNRSKTIINLTNKDFVYDKNPDQYADARPLEKVSWKDFREMVGDKWSPGLNVPFDPVASKEAQRSGIRVVAMGKYLKNLENFLKGNPFKGTVIGE